MSHPWDSGLLFDTNAVMNAGREGAPLASFSALCLALTERGVRCAVPTPVLAEYHRNKVAAINSALPPGLGPLAHVPLVDTLAKLSPAELLPFDEADVDALMSWTTNTYPTQAAYGRFKLEHAVSQASRAFRAGLGAMGKIRLDRDSDWNQVLKAVDTVCRDADEKRLRKLAKRVATTADWLIIGAALRHDLFLVTAETRREFSRVQARCVRLDALETWLQGTQ